LHRRIEAGKARLRPRNADVARGGPDEGRRAALAGGDLFEHRLLQPEAVLWGLPVLGDQGLHGAKIPSW
jgi:hypothetical protein